MTDPNLKDIELWRWHLLWDCWYTYNDWVEQQNGREFRSVIGFQEFIESYNEDYINEVKGHIMAILFNATLIDENALLEDSASGLSNPEIVEEICQLSAKQGPLTLDMIRREASDAIDYLCIAEWVCSKIVDLVFEIDPPLERWMAKAMLDKFWFNKVKKQLPRINGKPVSQGAQIPLFEF